MAKTKEEELLNKILNLSKKFSSKDKSPSVDAMTPGDQNAVPGLSSVAPEVETLAADARLQQKTSSTTPASSVTSDHTDVPPPSPPQAPPQVPPQAPPQVPPQASVAPPVQDKGLLDRQSLIAAQTPVAQRIAYGEQLGVIEQAPNAPITAQMSPQQVAANATENLSGAGERTAQLTSAQGELKAAQAEEESVAKSQQILLDAQQRQRQDAEREQYRQLVAKRQGQYESLIAEARTKTPDPSRFMKSMGNWDQILVTAFAAGMGGIGGQTIARIVSAKADADYAGQREKYGTVMDLIKANQGQMVADADSQKSIQGTFDADNAAMKLALADRLQTIAGQNAPAQLRNEFNIAANVIRSDIAGKTAKAAVDRAEIDQKEASAQASLASAEKSRRAGMGGGGGVPSITDPRLAGINKKYWNLVVFMPDKSIRLATSPEEAKLANTSMRGARTSVGAVDNVLNSISNPSTWTKIKDKWLSEDESVAVFKQNLQALALRIKDDAKLGALSASDMTIIDNILANPDDIDNVVKVKQIEAKVRNYRKIVIANISNEWGDQLGEIPRDAYGNAPQNAPADAAQDWTKTKKVLTAAPPVDYLKSDYGNTESGSDKLGSESQSAYSKTALDRSDNIDAHIASMRANGNKISDIITSLRGVAAETTAQFAQITKQLSKTKNPEDAFGLKQSLKLLNSQRIQIASRVKELTLEDKYHGDKDAADKQASENEILGR